MPWLFSWWICPIYLLSSVKNKRQWLCWKWVSWYVWADWMREKLSSSLRTNGVFRVNLCDPSRGSLLVSWVCFLLCHSRPITRSCATVYHFLSAVASCCNQITLWNFNEDWSENLWHLVWSVGGSVMSHKLWLSKWWIHMVYMHWGNGTVLHCHCSLN